MVPGQATRPEWIVRVAKFNGMPMSSSDECKDAHEGDRERIFEPPCIRLTDLALALGGRAQALSSFCCRASWRGLRRLQRLVSRATRLSVIAPELPPRHRFHCDKAIAWPIDHKPTAANADAWSWRSLGPP